MSDEQNNDNKPEGAEADPLLNLKSEISRKLQNSDTRMTELMKQNQLMTENLKALTSKLTPQAPAASEDDLETLAYSDPKKYAQKIAAMATRSAIDASNQVRQEDMQKTNILNSLYKDYPELSNTDSELTKAAVEVYNSLSPAEQASPSSYKLAVREAAAQLGVLPSSKRSSNRDDDFVAPGSRGNSGNKSDRSSKKDEIDPNILEISRLFGRDIKDPKVVERLKQHSKRTKWNRYE